MNKSINKSELVNRKFINNWNIKDFEIKKRKLILLRILLVEEE